MTFELLVALLEWSLAISYVAGAFLLVTKTPYASYGWVAILIATCLAIAHGLIVEHWSYVIVMSAFTAAFFIFRYGRRKEGVRYEH